MKYHQYIMWDATLNVGLFIKTEQLVKNIKTLNLLLNDNINKTLTIITINTFRLNLGSSQPILKLPKVDTKYINSPWCNNLINNIHKHKISFKLNTSNNSNDKVIMRWKLNIILNTPTLVKLNSCHLYFQVIPLSDITHQFRLYIIILIGRVSTL